MPRASPSIIETMHRALLPADLPVLPDLDVSGAYLMMAEESASRGDWFDAAPLPNGHLGLAVGDVVGRGVEAAAAMSRLRTMATELLVETTDVVTTLERLDDYAARRPEAYGATVCVGVLDPTSGRLSYATAAHPAPLMVGASPRPSVLPHTGGGPLGSRIRSEAGQAVMEMGDMIIMFTDGLIAHPAQPWTIGLNALAELARELMELPAVGRDDLVVERVCQGLISTLGETCDHDDAVVLAVQRHPATQDLDVTVPSRRDMLAHLRSSIHAWGRRLHLTDSDQYALEFVISEAAANSIDHGYDGTSGPVHAQAGLTGTGSVELTVDDQGSWVEPQQRLDGSGLGLSMIQDLTDDLLVAPHDFGTTVTMRRRLRRRTTIEQNAAHPTPAEEAVFGFDVRPQQQMIMVFGPIDLSTDTELEAVLQASAATGLRPMIIDLSGVTHLASAGVRVLHRHARRVPGAVFVVRDSSLIAGLLDLIALPGLEIVTSDGGPSAGAPGVPKTGR